MDLIREIDSRVYSYIFSIFRRFVSDFLGIFRDILGSFQEFFYVVGAKYRDFARASGDGEQVNCQEANITNYILLATR